MSPYDGASRASFLADAVSYADRVRLTAEQREALIALDTARSSRWCLDPLVSFLADAPVERQRRGRERDIGKNNHENRQSVCDSNVGPVPEEKRHRTDLGTKVKSDATLIRVETDNGLTGIGAALGTPPIVGWQAAAVTNWFSLPTSG